MGGLSPSQQHVIRRCSTVETWDRSGRTFGRQWPDIVAGRAHVSMQTVRSLVRQGYLYEDESGLYGLTPGGVRAWINIGPTKAAEPS